MECMKIKSEAQYFTLEQANAVVVAIRPLVTEMLDLRQSILAKQPEVWPVVAKAAGNGGSKVASEIAQEFQKLDLIVREIMATGVILKDINTGLFDFLSLRDGREVYLCWRYGEEQIIYWHEINAGFAGRQQI